MCDFLSICVRKDGAVAHIPKNSHSGAIAHYGWRENDQMADMRGKFFVEAEWNGQGKYPGAEKITRGEFNEKQRTKIDSIYTSLAELLNNPAERAEGMLFGHGIFAGDEWADIRWRVLIHPECPKRIADKLVAMKLHANGKAIKSLDPRITEIDGNLVIAEGYEITSHSLTKVGGNLLVSGSAKLDALTKVGGTLDVYGSARLDALTKVGGSLVVYGFARLDAPALKEVGGDLVVYGSAKLDAPKLNRKK